MTQVIDAPEVTPAPVAIEPRILERREQVARQRLRRRLRIAAVVGGAVVVVTGAWVALHSPVLAERHVVVIGAIHTGVGPVVAAADLSGQPLVDVNTGQVAARVEALPWVAHATVTRHWPDTLIVNVVERVPAAVVAGPGQSAVLVDSTGHVLAPAAAAPPGTVLLDAPVAAGRPGSVLGSAALRGLSVLGALPASIAPRLQQIDVAADGDVSLELSGRVGVTLGPADELAAKFEALVSVLVDVPPTGPEVIDVTVPDAPAVGPVPPAVSESVAKPPPTVSPAPARAGQPAPQTRRVA
jgi:cell division protein FtsQ